MSPHRPRIGIPLGLDERGRWHPGRSYQYLDDSYARAVESAGATPLYLPIQSGVGALVSDLDGLLVPGGDDFLPPHPHPALAKLDPVPERQLTFDRALVEAALARAIPVLGICYGAQLLALACAGELVYHLPTDRPSAGDHRLDEEHGRHAIHVEPESRLAHILGPDAGPVNSLHHQAIAAAGRGLRVCARAGDGEIEAIEGDGDAFVLGVQWHPERMSGAHRDALFAAFVAAARPHTSGRSGPSRLIPRPHP
jgi:putative glutamine amidotransferase